MIGDIWGPQLWFQEFMLFQCVCKYNGPNPYCITNQGFLMGTLRAFPERCRDQYFLTFKLNDVKFVSKPSVVEKSFSNHIITFCKKKSKNLYFLRKHSFLYVIFLTNAN